MIEAIDLRAGYGDGPDILNGISLTAKPGELVTILGPNGCGKSTLLKTIAGYVLPRSGQVHLNDRDAAHVPIHRKVRDYKVGYVPQTDNVFATLTVAENLALGGRGLSPEAQEAAQEALLGQYPSLAAKLRRRASALSGGERQLLSLARALMSGPQILLLDEPSAGLSPKMLHEVFDAIARIRDEQGLCIVMVEQNAYEALTVACRAYVLALGQVAISARAGDLLADPKMRALYLGGHVEEA